MGSYYIWEGSREKCVGAAERVRRRPQSKSRDYQKERSRKGGPKEGREGEEQQGVSGDTVAGESGRNEAGQGIFSLVRFLRGTSTSPYHPLLIDRITVRLTAPSAHPQNVELKGRVRSWLVRERPVFGTLTRFKKSSSFWGGSGKATQGAKQPRGQRARRTVTSKSIGFACPE